VLTARSLRVGGRGLEAEQQSATRCGHHLPALLCLLACWLAGWLALFLQIWLQLLYAFLSLGRSA
jgi:hypothetical protein